ncbi:hypothetical protein [Legionella nautarum]|uniref:hypothetical protein n=1 Tax=Legionella nautarum TaxID=45070 RepID=UPI001056D2D2|nr:hypothetical protein [Legionella nautarum]
MREKLLNNLKELQILTNVADDNEQINEFKKELNTLSEIVKSTDGAPLAKLDSTVKELLKRPIVLKLRLLNELEATASMIISDSNLSQKYLEDISKYISQACDTDKFDELTKIQSEFQLIARPIQLALLRSMIQPLTTMTTSPETEITSAAPKTAQPNQASATGKSQSGWISITSNLASKLSTFASETKTKLADYTAEKLSSSSPQTVLLDSLKKYHRNLSEIKNLTYPAANMLSLKEQYDGLTSYPLATVTAESKKSKLTRKKVKRRIAEIIEPKDRELSQNAYRELLKFQELQELDKLTEEQREEFKTAGISEETVYELIKMKSFLSLKAQEEFITAFKAAGINEEDSRKALEELQKMGKLSAKTIAVFAEMKVGVESLRALRKQSRVARFERIGVLKDELKELTTISEDLLKTEGVTISSKALNELHQSKLSIRAREQLEDLKTIFEGLEEALQKQREEMGEEVSKLAAQEKTQPFSERLLAYQKSRVSEETLNELEHSHLSAETIQEFEKAGISPEILAKIQRSEKVDFQETKLNDKVLKELQKPKLSETTVKELQERITLAELKEQNDELDKEVAFLIGELNGYLNLAKTRELTLTKEVLAHPLISTQLGEIKALQPLIEKNIGEFNGLIIEVSNVANWKHRHTKLKLIQDALKKSYDDIEVATNRINAQIEDLKAQANESFTASPSQPPSSTFERSQSMKGELQPSQLTDHQTQTPIIETAVSAPPLVETTSTLESNAQKKISLETESTKEQPFSTLREECKKLETTYFARVENINSAIDRFATTRAVIIKTLNLEQTDDGKKAPPKEPESTFIERRVKEVKSIERGVKSLLGASEGSVSENKSAKPMDKPVLTETAFQKQIRLTKSNLLSNNAFMEALEDYNALVDEFYKTTKTKEESLVELSSDNSKSTINDSERLRRQNEAIANSNLALQEVETSLTATVATLNNLIAKEDENRKNLIAAKGEEISKLLSTLRDLSKKTSENSSYSGIIINDKEDGNTLDIAKFEAKVKKNVENLLNFSTDRISVDASFQKEKIEKYISTFEKAIIDVNMRYLANYEAANNQIEILRKAQSDFSLAQIKAKNPLVQENQAEIEAQLKAEEAVVGLREGLNQLTKPELDEQKQPKPICYNLNKTELMLLLEETTKHQQILARHSSNLKARASSEEVKIVREMMSIATDAAANLPPPPPTKSGMKKADPASEVLTKITKGLQEHLDTYFTNISKTTEEERTHFITQCIDTMYKELSEENLMNLSQRNEAQTIIVETINSLIELISNLAKFLSIPVSAQKRKFNTQFWASPTEETMAAAAENAHTQLKELKGKLDKNLPKPETETETETETEENRVVQKL